MKKITCKSIKRCGLWLMVIVVCSITPQALSIGMEEFGDKSIKPRTNWMPGLADIVNSPGRVYSYEVNGDEHYFWRGDEVAFNAVLRQFSQFSGGELVILPAPGTVRTFDGKELEIFWELHVPGGFYLTRAQREGEATIRSKHPVLTVYVGGKKGLDVNKLKISKTLQILTIKDLLQRYLQGLESRLASVRKNAAYLLATMTPVAEYAILPLIEHLKDPDPGVRGQAAATLGSWGLKAYAALPTLRSIVKTEEKSKSVKKLAKVAIEKIEHAENTESQKQHKIVRQIEAFKKTEDKGREKPATQDTPGH